jgi:hypothetical protein
MADQSKTKRTTREDVADWITLRVRADNLGLICEVLEEHARVTLGMPLDYIDPAQMDPLVRAAFERQRRAEARWLLRLLERWEKHLEPLDVGAAAGMHGEESA